MKERRQPLVSPVYHETGGSLRCAMGSMDPARAFDGFVSPLVPGQRGLFLAPMNYNNP